MSTPNIADRQPKAVELEAGKAYSWCACGQSSTQPFCDGSHKDTGFLPKPLKPEESRTAYLCMCKRTGTPPYCDGTHNQLPDPSAGG